MIREKGYPVVDLDSLAHRVIEPGKPAYEKIVSRFGHEILNPDHTIDRRKLGRKVFPDPEARRELESYTQVKSVTVLKMEVPCCTGIAQTARIAMDASPFHMPIRCLTIGVGGEIQEDVQLEPGTATSMPQAPSGCGGSCPSIG